MDALPLATPEPSAQRVWQYVYSALTPAFHPYEPDNEYK
jgi:hypothetical protein